MFWIGAAAGAFICLAGITIAIACIGWGVAKDRAKDSAEGDRYKVDSKQLFYYWEECNRANQEENDILRQILEKMPNKG